MSDLKTAIVRNPLVVTPDTTVMDAIAQMSGVRALCETAKSVDDQLDEIHLEARSSCVLVVEDERLRGIFTERDVVRLSTQQHCLEHLTIRAVMTTYVVTLHETEFTDLFFAINLLQQYHIRHLPILDAHDRLAGLVTNESLQQTFRSVDLLRLRLVSEVMTSAVICAPPESTMMAIAQRMATHRVSSVMIVRSSGSVAEPLELPVGIVTERDIVQFQALGLNLATCLAETVMSTPIFTVKMDDSLWVVQQIMEERLIRRLAVVGEQGQLLGIVTQTSLLHAFNPLELYKLAEALEEKVVQLEAEKVQLLKTRTIELEEQVEKRTLALKAQAEREQLVAAIATQIRSSLSLQTILDTTVEQVRQVLGCDRVTIWQFEADWQTIAVAESTDSALSLIGERINDTCFKQHQADIYRQGKIHVVPDIDAIGLSACHRDLLIRLQTRAKILVPLLCGDELWGLLNASESQHARNWQPEEVALLQALSVQLAIALQQATTHQQLQDQLAERLQTEARLRASEQRYISLTAAAPVGIFRTDANGNCTYVNDRWCQIAGLTTEEAFGEGWRQGLHPDDRACIAAEWYQAAQEARPFHLEYRFQRPDGSVTWVYGQAVAEQEPNGQVIGYVGTITDISDRKYVEAALIQSEAQSRAILAAIPDFMFRVGADGIYRGFVTLNRQIDLLPTELDSTGSAMMDILPPDIAARQQHYMEQALKTGELQIYEQQVQANGRLQDEEVRVVKSGNDEVLFMIRDISDRKRSEEALKRSEAHQRALVSAIPDLIMRINRAGIYLEFVANPTFHVVGNLPDLVGTHVYESLPLHLAQKRMALIEQALQTYTVQVYEQDLSIDSKMQIEEVRVVPYEADEVLLLVRDISDRKQAELQLHQLNQSLEAKVTARTAELQEREAELQKLSERLALSLKSGAIGCWEWDLIQNVVRWDDRMYELYGVSKDTDAYLAYDRWVERLHPDDREATEAFNQQAISGQTEYDTEFRVIHPDGSIHFIKAHGMLVRDAQSKPQSIIGINFDISDRKHTEQIVRQQADREKLLREITQRIRQSLDIQTIFDTACQEIRQVIQADRVGIFKFYPESHFDDGVFVAQAVVEGFSSVVNIQVRDHCFGEKYAPLYVQGRYAAMDDIYQLEQCHSNVLAMFQVRANLVMPLICGEVLWGLLCIHQCAAPRHWQQSEIDFTQQIANQLAIAIQQANLYEQIQSELIVRQQAEARIALQLRRQRALASIVQQIRESLDISEILTAVTQQVQKVLRCDRVIVFQLSPDGRSHIAEEAVSSQFSALKDRHWEDEQWAPEILEHYWQGKPRIVPDVMNDRWTDCLVDYNLEGQIQSKIVAPILQDVHSNEAHRWTAPWQCNKLWGILVVHACREARVWQETEAQLLQQIANQLAIGIQQANLFKQLQQELTERQQAETKLTESNQQLAISNQELARATRLKDEFLANMSHELRTPLNAILGLTEGLQEQVFGSISDRQLKALQTIEQSGSHLLSLINDILDVAKIEAGQIELDCAPVSIKHLCQSSLAFIKQQALQKRIQLDTQLSPNLPDLLMDERRMRQVLINLLNNAVKFTPPGGHIILEVTQTVANLIPNQDAPTHWLQIAVRDTGIGIAPEDINKLFQPFIQIDSALNRQYSGTGLGLVLVKRIVELHSGRVGLTSELGAGSCFTIELPCAFTCTPHQKAAAEKLCDVDSPGAPATIERSPLLLLAEDNEANISTISSYLGAKGYRLVLAKHGQAAIDLTLTHKPDLILMDIQMPGMDGLEAINQLRAMPALATVPIIALTALAMPGDRERCLGAGANDYLTKPVRLKELSQLIQTLLAT
ncbi:MAG: GAF domain-containing protein [Leptolyngbya sp. BL-A-14]